MPSFATAVIPEDAPGPRYAQKSREDELQEDVENVVVMLLNVAITLESISGRKQSHCHICGEWDDAHSSDCLVPALERWLAKR